MAVMVTLMILDQKYGYQIEVSPEGHSFISLVVGFLLVSRVSIALSVYMEERKYLEDMSSASRELIQNACAFSLDNTENAAKEWRFELSYRCLLLLRTTMAVIDFPTSDVPAWNVPELKGFELKSLSLLHPKYSATPMSK
jgi:predicted membrane chloride channel (bestrophin family)